MTVGQIRDMPAAEWLGWGIYYARKAQARQLAEMRNRKG